MSFQSNFPQETKNLSPARRRQYRRRIIPEGSDEQAAYLEQLAQRSIPSLEFFVYSILSGILLIAAIWMDAPAVFVLVAAAAPFLAPLFGLSLAAVVGSFQFLFQCLGSLLISGGIMFVFGLIAGIGKSFAALPELSQLSKFTQFSWWSLFAVTIGAAATSVLIARQPERRQIPATSVVVAYVLYLPLGAAGFGLATGLDLFWPNGLILFGIYLVWAALIGAVTLAILGLRPKNFFGYALGTALAVIAIVTIFVVSGIIQAGVSSPESTDVVPGINRTEPQAAVKTSSGGESVSSKQSTPTPPLVSSTPTNTLIPTRTPTYTVSPMPTPAWAMISSRGADGAVIRAEPSFDALYVQSMLNGMLVQMLPDTVEAEGVTWVYVKATVDGDREVEGWIVKSLLTTATPVP
jgi:hypothetical protein